MERGGKYINRDRESSASNGRWKGVYRVNSENLIMRRSEQILEREFDGIVRAAAGTLGEVEVKNATERGKIRPTVSTYSDI